MFEKFASNFRITGDLQLTESNKEFYKGLPDALFEFYDKFGGQTFNDGLYRAHSFSSSITWSSIIARYFNKYKGVIYPFAFDWMGRQFCISINNSQMIYMFDVETCEDFELQQDLVSYHNNDLVEDVDAMLSEGLFIETLRLNNVSDIKYNECFSFKKPLLLGGEDKIENYEQTDIEVYWDIQGQIVEKVKSLPPGTKVNIRLS